MKYYKILIVLLLLALLFSGKAIEGKPVLAQSDQPAPEKETGIYSPETDTLSVPSGITGYTDLVHQGTAWVSERRSNFTMFKSFAWGTVAKAKVAGDEWVHIPVTFASVIDGTPVKVKRVEFCAASSAGVQTRPIKVDLWSNRTRFESLTVNWTPDNNYHCWFVDYGGPAWRESLGISVLLHFANTTDTITLYKAWVRLVP